MLNITFLDVEKTHFEIVSQKHCSLRLAKQLVALHVRTGKKKKKSSTHELFFFKGSSERRCVPSAAAPVVRRRRA